MKFAAFFVLPLLALSFARAETGYVFGVTVYYNESPPHEPPGAFVVTRGRGPQVPDLLLSEAASVLRYSGGPYIFEDEENRGLLAGGMVPISNGGKIQYFKRDAGSGELVVYDAKQKLAVIIPLRPFEKPFGAYGNKGFQFFTRPHSPSPSPPPKTSGAGD